MKKIVVFSIVLGCLCSISTMAQEVSPGDLKTARNAVYEWINNYNVYAKCTGRSAQSQFYSLFEDESVALFNDYFPMANYNVHNTYITVDNYVDLVGNKDRFYEMKYDVRNGTIQSEEYKDGKIIYTVSFVKKVWFIQRGSQADDRYEYPAQDLDMEVMLEYDINRREIVAKSLSCISPIRDFLVFHHEGKNTFESIHALNAICSAKSTRLVRYRVKPMFFDEKMIELTSDTLKRYIGFGYTVGLEGVKAPISDLRFSNYSIKGGVQQSIWGSFYQQFLLKNQHRWGVEVSLMYKNSSSVAELIFNDSYNDIDPDGSRYERLMVSNSYKEESKRYILEIPIIVKYEYLYSNDLSFFAQAGVGLAYDIKREVEATGEMEYKGYYDWLFNVTLSQNGIYDFGRFPLVQKASDFGIGKLNVGGIISIGGCYYFADNWMVELAFKYRGTLWGDVNKEEVYHLSRYDGDWTSISYRQDKYITNAFNFQLQINYNF